MKCTWKDCQREAECPQKDKTGKEWANLCKEHDKEIEDVFKSEKFDVKKVLKCWVLASGGADKLSKEMAHGLNKGIKEIQKRYAEETWN